jgi:hypothetical protein
MARDAIAVTDLASGAGTTNPAGTAITPANGGNIAPGAKKGKIIVRVTNTNGTIRAVTFRAGVNPPAVRKGIGDLVVNVPATTGDLLFVLETARFQQADGSINVDYATGMAGIVSAVRAPRGA